MKNMLKARKSILVLSVLFLFPSLARAQQWLQMDPKVLIDIESYDPTSQTFEITDLKYPAQGPLILTPEELVKCIPSLDIERVRRAPTSVIHEQYQTEREMMFLSPKQIADRKKRLKHS